MSRSFLWFSALSLAASIGCGSIVSRDAASIATVSGTLQGGSVPSGARVALVWHRPSGGYVVTNETAMAGGAFSLDLNAPPPDDLFFTPEQGDTVESGGGAAIPPDPDVRGPSGASGGSAGPGASQLGTRSETVSGGVVGAPMSLAAAGFVLYVDTNGNGRLDLTGDNADSPDQILGGSSELALLYLRDGSNLDYEKLRDKTGQLPGRGYALVWEQKERWLPLSAVELRIGDTRLASLVCRLDNTTGTTLEDEAPSSQPLPAPGEGTSGYPSPSDPSLHCSRDGRSFTYSYCPPSPVVEPQAGLCRPRFSSADSRPCASEASELPEDGGVPEGWPCAVVQESDAGTADGGR